MSHRLQPGMRGVLAIYVHPNGDRRPVAECVRCERARTIYSRGLCASCYTRSRQDGTLADYGCTRAERLAEYIELPRHLTARQAAGRLGVSVRTVERYKRDLRTGRPA